MPQLYEPSDPLRFPFECFTYDSSKYPFPVPPHWHYFAELLLVRSGSVSVTNNDRELLLSPGEAAFVFPQSVHSIGSPDAPPVVYDVIKADLNQLKLSPAYAPELKKIIEDASLHHMCTRFDADAVRQMLLSERVGLCLKECREKAYGYDLIVQSTLHQIMTDLIRQWMLDGFSIQRSVYQSELFGSVASITSYIEDHLRETLRVEDLANYCRMSYPSFARKFRALYGISCKEYIEQVRIARVEHFLLFTDWELTFISQEAGYADCSHMIRDFKRLKGMTPGKYRLQQLPAVPSSSRK